MGILQILSFRGALSDYEDKGTPGAFKFGANLDVRKITDSLSAGQALVDEGITLQSASASVSPSASISASASASPSPSRSISPSASFSPSPPSPSASVSPSASKSPSASASPSASVSPSSSSSASPSPSAGLKSVFSDLIRFFVVCSDGKTYGFGHTGKVYKRNSDAYWIQVYDLQKPIVGAIEKPSSGGKTYLLFATATELHRKEIPGQSNWNDVDKAGTVQGDTWPKTNLTQADWHTMADVGGDTLIANASTLAMSAYDDSYTNEALDLIPGNVAKTVLERNGRAVIGTFRAGDPNKGINGAVDAENPLIQVGDDGYLYFADFINSVSVKRFPGGGKVNPGGMTNQITQITVFDWEQNALSWINKQVIGNMAMMAVYGATTGKGGIYTYGRKIKNHPAVLNLEYQLDADELGACTSVNGTTLVSYRQGTNFGVKASDPNNKAIGIYEGLDFKSPVKLPIAITQYTTAELSMAPLPSGCSVQFWYRMNKNGAFVQADTTDGQTAFSTANGRKATFRINAEGDIFEPRVVLIPHNNDTAEVYRIRVFFK